MSGPTGPRGPQGVQGEQGIQGVQGQQGVQGEQGPRGFDGSVGPVGATGPQGVPGSQGEQGVQGEKGDKGDEGPTGPQGIEGPQGNDGIQGIDGPTGPRGVQGIKGDTGAQGPTGPAGSVVVGGSLPVVTYYLSSDVTIGTGNEALLVFDTLDSTSSVGTISGQYNSGILFNTTSDTLTYLITGTVYTTSNGLQMVEVRRNHSNVLFRSSLTISGSNYSSIFSGVVVLSPGDFVYVVYTNVSGDLVNIHGISSSGNTQITSLIITQLDHIQSSNSYISGNSSLWSGSPPTNVNSAIDRLASLMYTLNSNTSIP